MRWQHLHVIGADLQTRHSTKTSNTQHTAHKYNQYIIRWMLCSPLATGKGVIGVVTNVWDWNIETGGSQNTYTGNTGGIDVGHIEGFWKVDSSWEGNWVLKYWTIQRLLYLSESRNGLPSWSGLSLQVGTRTVVPWAKTSCIVPGCVPIHWLTDYVMTSVWMCPTTSDSSMSLVHGSHGHIHFSHNPSTKSNWRQFEAQILVILPGFEVHITPQVCI